MSSPLPPTRVPVPAEAEEYFDVFTEAGEPTGKTELRRIVHAKGLYHQSVYCFVFDKEKRLLLQVATVVGPMMGGACGRKNRKRHCPLMQQRKM